MGKVRPSNPFPPSLLFCSPSNPFPPSPLFCSPSNPSLFTVSSLLTPPHPTPITQCFMLLFSPPSPTQCSFPVFQLPLCFSFSLLPSAFLCFHSTIVFFQLPPTQCSVPLLLCFPFPSSPVFSSVSPCFPSPFVSLFQSYPVFACVSPTIVFILLPPIQYTVVF